MIPNNKEVEEHDCLLPVSTYFWEGENTWRRGAFLALTATYSALLQKLFFFPTDQCIPLQPLQILAFPGMCDS